MKKQHDMHYKEIPMIIGQMAVMRLLSAFFYLPQNGGQRKCQYEKKSRDDFARGLFLKIFAIDILRIKLFIVFRLNVLRILILLIDNAAFQCQWKFPDSGHRNCFRIFQSDTGFHDLIKITPAFRSGDS